MQLLALPLSLSLVAFPAVADTIGPWPDTPLWRYFRDLVRPDIPVDEYAYQSRSCCGAGDVVKTRFRVLPGDDEFYPVDTWYAWLDGEWTKIPHEKIVPGHAPDGQAYLFTTIAGFDQHGELKQLGTKQIIICFVRPKGDI